MKLDGIPWIKQYKENISQMSIEELRKEMVKNSEVEIRTIGDHARLKFSKEELDNRLNK